MTSPVPSDVQVPNISGAPQALIDNVQVTTTAGTVQRQVVTVGDASAGGNYASVNSSGGIAISGAGSTGTDWSANSISVAAHLLLTIPVNANRNFVGVQNQSGEQIQVVRDKGDGTQLTILLLESGGANNTGGGEWGSTTFKGRLRVYSATSTDQVGAYED